MVNIKHLLLKVDHLLMSRNLISDSMQGIPDYDAIEAFRDIPFFRYSLGIDQCPSSPTLRQRLDEVRGSFFRSLQSLGHCLAKSLPGVHDPRYVGGWSRGDFLSSSLKISQKEGEVCAKYAFYQCYWWFEALHP